MSKLKMILDLDTGIDDALALAYALASPEVELIGVTTTYGNVTLKQGAENVLRLLQLLGAPHVPVFKGLAQAAAADHFTVQPISAQIHGENGLGEVALPPAKAQVDSQPAVDFMLAASAEYGSDLAIVATGPATNLAAAIAKDLDTMKKIGKIVVMGGALTVCGNVSPFAEANISQDPAAADCLFRSGLPVTMVGLDVTIRTLLQPQDTKRWRDLDTPAAVAFAAIADYYIRAYAITSPHLAGCALHDPLAVAVAIQPDLVTTLDLPLLVETSGPSAGRTIGDNLRINSDAPTVAVAVNVKAQTFQTQFNSRLLRLLAKN